MAGKSRSTLMRALASVFLAARVSAALQAFALAATQAGRRRARQRLGGFAIGFGNEFVAHDVKFLSSNGGIGKTGYCHCFLAIWL